MPLTTAQVKWIEKNCTATGSMTFDANVVVKDGVPTLGNEFEYLV